MSLKTTTRSPPRTTSHMFTSRLEKDLRTNNCTPKFTNRFANSLEECVPRGKRRGELLERVVCPYESARKESRAMTVPKSRCSEIELPGGLMSGKVNI